MSTTKRKRKLIEQYRRRDGFAPDERTSTPVTLADGQVWHLGRPWLELVPIFRDGKPVDHARVLTCGDELDFLLELIARAKPGPAQILAVMAVGAFLLRRNYDLEDDELNRLFVFRGDDDSQAMLRAIISTATGGLDALFGQRGATSDPKSRAAG